MAEMVWIVQSGAITAGGTTTVNAYIPVGSWIIERAAVSVNGTNASGVVSIRLFRTGSATSLFRYVPVFPGKPTISVDTDFVVEGGNYVSGILENGPASGGTTLGLVLLLKKVE